MLQTFLAGALAAFTLLLNPAEEKEMPRASQSAPNDPATVLYPGPDGVAASDLYSVKVNGRELLVYPARASAKPVHKPPPDMVRPPDETELTAFACWDMSGPVEVEVVSSRAVESVKVRPLSLHIEPAVEGDTITFQLPKPCQITVEVNDEHQALHLFANPPEENPPAPDAPGVRYFGPGAHEAGKIDLRSDETLYIAGGAVVRGFVQADGAENVKILGRGILDGSAIKRAKPHNLIRFSGCRNVEVSGIVLLDPPVWTVVPSKCEGVRLTNLKVIGAHRYNSDGFDIVDCQDVIVKDSFVRGFDDGIIVKSFDPEGQDIRDIRVENCVLWTDWGISLGVTYETRAKRIRDIVFRNCDVIHNIVCRAALTINPSDRGEISNILFEDIRVEDARSGLIEVVVEKTIFGKDEERGKIRDIVFRNISVTGGPFPHSIIKGFDAEHNVSNILIENLTIHGKRIQTAEQGQFQIGPHAEGVRFSSPKENN